MKTNVKNLIIIGITFLSIAMLSFGYEIARIIWGPHDPLRFFLGAICLFWAILMFLLARKKEKEENLSQK